MQATAHIIDGKAAARRLRETVAIEVSRLQQAHGLRPGLAVVLVGQDPASDIYVRNKGRQTNEAGMLSREYRLDASVSEAEVLELIDTLNRDPEIHGILAQLPMPAHIDEQRVIETISPQKDVDGFHPLNAGELANGTPGALVPCTPLGCLFMLREHFHGDLSGQNALVIGRSNIVGKPMAQLLLQESCTVTIAHSRTRDLPAVCRRADIVVAAVGRPEMVRGDWVAPGAVVMDVGINRLPVEGGKSRLVGDVAFDEVCQVASAITPVPGGVGPMTIACLLRNTVIAACRQAGVSCELP
ncbi:bifunctional methylenetetrahydrofolate dehydrogenase/methenyltetrahydrofolate cyclohydrolase FolD [Chromatocurvus halotolerans]|uniref:Bifunctional protein FolD n=1 Tax=Chromatocurvus halotolerans TaxID=1132028 RepID=A0A4R2L6V3_9GAMM|nr:bifunctional methylenetetrahydrofolate dehydrogenase/methenyltetrahydrofolate cyclohydrolase FolD [Chromatocurvus halotolerans]TCO78398.1 methylenetetrahydrofolate dehydrogenase (NADP+)/methenyltetrahydrofolate cyclohydrolase [Chromatocurvus halotolerans]